MLWKIFFITSLINFIFAQKLFNKMRKLEDKNIINLTVFCKGNFNLINKTYKPDLVLLNDNKIDLYENGNIFINNEEVTNNIKLIWNKRLNRSDYLFNGANCIKEVDFSDFDFSLVTSMSYMFADNTKLEYINFGKINTSLVTDMSYMFSNCNNLLELNLSYFNTSLVKKMEGMFLQCSSLVSLDITNFNTSNVLTMYEMFKGLEKIIDIDLSKLNTSKVTNMRGLFKS